MAVLTKENAGKAFDVTKTAVAVSVAVVQGIELIAAAAHATQRVRSKAPAQQLPRTQGRGWRVDRHDWEYDPVDWEY